MKKRDIIENSKKQSAIKSPTTGAFIELDYWIPNLNICFEFQDTYHFTTAWYAHRTLANVKLYDNIHLESAQLAGICLIAIPCWWDGNYNSLLATIKFSRPDLVENVDISQNDTIPYNPPIFHFSPFEVPDVGELMLASFKSDRNSLFENSNVSSWWIGEKYDGIRCCWNPPRYVLPLPSSFLASLPPIFLDSELWFGRGTYEMTRQLGSDSNATEWQYLKMLAFDVPSKDFHEVPFEDRYKQLLLNITRDNPFVYNALRFSGTTKIQVKGLMEHIMENRGEGLMLRLKNSLYEHGRSSVLVKLKVTDKEALVIGVDNSTVTLKLPNEQTFTVESSSVTIPNLQPGQVVTFSYESNLQKSVGSIVNPKIIRIRTDLNWDDVVRMVAPLIPLPKKEGTILNNKHRVWKRWTHKSMRKFLEKIALSLNLNPLLPQSWFTISSSDICRFRGGQSILKYFKGYVLTLQALFPDIGINFKDLYRLHSPTFWGDIQNRREFFKVFAKAQNFDPLVAENWYSQHSNILSFKRARGVLQYHDRNVSKALHDLFPDISFDPSSFIKMRRWGDSENRRRLFEKYAKQNNFDPVVPDNWYQQSSEKLLSFQGIAAVINQRYNGNKVRALLDIFPSIGLDEWKFNRRRPIGLKHQIRYSVVPKHDE